VTTVVWLVVTWVTAPADPDVLRRFYQKVRPAGPGWAAVRREAGNLPSSDNLSLAFLGWLAGCTFVFSALFGTGHILLGHPIAATISILLFLASGVALYRLLPRLW
jgi:hypothetical protein